MDNANQIKLDDEKFYNIMKIEEEDIKKKKKIDYNAKIIDLINSVVDDELQDDVDNEEKTVEKNDEKTVENEEEENIRIDNNNIKIDDMNEKKIDNIKLSKTHTYSTILSKIGFEYTTDDSSLIKEELYKALDEMQVDSSKIIIFSDQKLAAKNALYDNEKINTKIFFKIFLLNIPVMKIILDNNNNNNDVNFDLALNTLYQILSLSKLNPTNEIIIYDEKSKNKIHKNKTKVFKSEFCLLLTSLYSDLNDIKQNLNENCDKIKFKFVNDEAMDCLNKLKDNNSSTCLTNKNPKQILDIIVFFVQYYNHQNKRLNLMLMEKTEDLSNQISLCMLNKIVLKSTADDDDQVFENKFSSKIIKKFFIEEEFDFKCILVFDEKLNSLYFYEYDDLKTIWSHLDNSFDCLVEPIVTQYVIQKKMFKTIKEQKYYKEKYNNNHKNNNKRNDVKAKVDKNVVIDNNNNFSSFDLLKQSVQQLFEGNMKLKNQLMEMIINFEKVEINEENAENEV